MLFLFSSNLQNNGKNDCSLVLKKMTDSDFLHFYED